MSGFTTLPQTHFGLHFSAVGGIVADSRVPGVSSSSGQGTIPPAAIAAAVIRGKGSVWDALPGALVIGSLAKSLDLIGADTVAKHFAEGSILVLAATVGAILTCGRVFARGGT